jgi:phenylacetate-CoA ligase
VVTDLNNFCMPFIRYRIGDLAVALDPAVPCPCGRGLPRLGRIEGRVQSMILGADGHVVPGSLFPHLFKDYDFVIRQFQVVQEEPGAVRLKVVKAARFDEKVFADALGILRRYLGECTHIDVEFVDHIPMVRTGKRQVSLSTVKIDFQELRRP